MAGIYRRVIQTVDSHTEGNSTRVITGGYPVPPGRTLLERRAWLWRHDDGLRRMLNFEPRGHGMMCSVLLMPPVDERADFSVIIMEQDEYVPMCGHCMIGTATTLVATGMVRATEPLTAVTIETPAGLVRCEVEVQGGRIGGVGFTNVESFLLHRDVELAVEGSGGLRLDIAYGGDFYAIVDADPLGLRLAADNDVALIAAARSIIRAVGGQLDIRHPERPDINRCYQTLFTSSATSTGDLKQTIVCPPGSLDRSPCGTGTSARVAALHARGELALRQPTRFEGVLGTCFTGEAVAAQERAGVLYVTPKVTGRAWITGFHQFVLDADDPLPEGFRIGHPPRPAPDPERGS
jgi:proline racemase